MRRIVIAICVSVLIVLTVTSRAQTFDLNHDREAIVALDGLWRFHPGDDARWADANFDDSQWPLLRSDRDWSQQGYKDMSGMAWYRFRVAIPADSPRLSLYVPLLLTSYEVYADGARIGGSGGMPPHAEIDHGVAQAIALPSSKAAHTVTVAIRVWHAPFWASYFGGGPHAAALIGTTPLIAERVAQDELSQAWDVVDEILLAILESLAGLAALAFFYMRPREREYLWFGLMLLFSAAVRSFSNWAQGHRFSVLLRDDIAGLLMGLSTLAAVAFYFRLLRGRRNWFFWLAVGATVASMFAEFADGWLITVQQSQAMAALFLIPFSAWVLVVLFRAARAGVVDARLLLFPVLMQQAAALIGIGVWLSYLAGWQHTYAQEDVALSNWPFFFTLSDLTALLFLLAMLAILINRFTRTRREEERFAAELDAARSVQQVMIPNETPSIPGFVIASVYRPASEVGGDFFQVIPLAESGDDAGSALIVVGDVSGKGLQAAMNVSLIVGSLRTLVERTQQPAEILAGLNRRLLGRSGGFTTCLVMLIDAVGTVTMATAGHPAPYCNGEELVLEDGLPLGLVPETVYAETRFQLAPGATLTVISDGVVEARDASGEVFGFDRTRALSTQEADYIAAAAEDFGQEDDITVLTLRRLAV